MPGGVADYTQSIARGLAEAGQSVYVWCPGHEGHVIEGGVRVGRVAGCWDREGLAHVDGAMSATPGPRRLLVQWVPHAYGRRSLNLPFSWWVRRRAKRGDIVDLMVHEPFLAFREGSVRQDAAAVIHRIMVSTLLSVARRVWVAIPAWADAMRPWAFGRTIEFCWRPVPSSIPVVDDASGAARLRSEHLQGNTDLLIGHFSTYDRNTRATLDTLVPEMLTAIPDAHLLLLGRGSGAFAARLAGWQDRVCGLDHLPPTDLSLSIGACDLMVQPYIDGASTRRTTLMAALAHGMPVVTTIGHLSEPFWRESDAVAAVDGGDHDAFIEAVRRLAGDPDRRREQSAAARALYEARFAVEHTVQALLHDVCNDIAGGLKPA